MSRSSRLSFVLLLAACTDNAEPDDATQTTTSPSAVDEDGDGFDPSTDCDDTDAAVNPDASEVCDGIDNDCNDLVDDDDPGTDPASESSWYSDNDSDGYGDSDSMNSGCDQPPDVAGAGGDCDDSDAAVNPGVEEICGDGIDNDCSGDAPECTYAARNDSIDADVTFSGDGSLARFGSNITVADINGDGVEDLVMGARIYSETADSQGAVFAAYGPLTAGDRALVTDSDWTFLGEDEGDQLGSTVKNVGDLDNDGLDDVVIGGYLNEGHIYLLYGGTTIPELIVSSTQSGDSVGYGVVAMGDLNGDGYPEIAVGMPLTNHESGKGASYLIFGNGSAVTAGEPLESIAGAVIRSTNDTDTSTFGLWDVLAAGDLDGDGIRDIVAGMHLSGDGFSGAVFTFSGPVTVGADIDPSIAEGEWRGAADNERLGEAVGAPDIDDDGYADMLASSSADGGQVYVLAGSSTGFSGPGDIAAEAMVHFDGSVESSHGKLGFHNRFVDLDGDGGADLSLDDPYAPDDGDTLGGSFVFFGPMAAGTYSRVDADTSFRGEETGSFCGNQRSSIGDLDADGLPDFILDCPQTPDTGGDIHVFFGFHGGM